MRSAVVIALGILIAACSSSSDGGSSLTPRDDRGDDDDDGKPKVDAGSILQDAAPIVDAGPPSTTCTVGGLALCYAFDGAATDGSPNKVTAKTSNVTFVAGREAQAASFASASTMTFEPNQIFELPKDAATVEAWIKRESTGANAVVFDAQDRFTLAITAAGKLACGSSGGAVIGTTDILVADWTHVACVIDKGELRAYVNGKEDGKGPGEIASKPELGAALGQKSPTGLPYIGLIDSFRLMWLARTATDLAADATPGAK